MEYSFNKNEVKLIKQAITDYCEEDGESTPNLDEVIVDIEQGLLSETGYVFLIWDSLGLDSEVREASAKIEKLYQDASKIFMSQAKAN